jgi:hypothetical protein
VNWREAKGTKGKPIPVSKLKTGIKGIGDYHGE